MLTESHYITSDPEILGGTPVFVGTRVPFSYLMEYLERGSTIEQFVAHYPSVTLAQAAKALEEASEVVEDFVHAHTA
jgi:uncharacterized protein (DUF433 family)